MSAIHDHMDAVLAPLEAQGFVLCEPTLTPAIPADKHGVVYYVPNVRPLAQLDGARRAIAWNVAVISPVTGMKAASGPLLDALLDVLKVVEAEPTTTWTSADMEPYNDTLWCYAVEVGMYAIDVPDDVPDEP